MRQTPVPDFSQPVCSDPWRLGPMSQSAPGNPLPALSACRDRAFPNVSGSPPATRTQASGAGADSSWYSSIFLCRVLRLIPNRVAAFVWTP